MFQNMLMSSLTPLSFKTEINSWENQPFATVWPDNVQQKTKEIIKTIKKKPKRVRTAFSTDQILTLEKAFSRYKYINSDKRRSMANFLKVDEKCIKIWFQNRRMKEKRESLESNCDSSSECLKSESPSLSSSPPTQENLADYKNVLCANQPYFYNHHSEYYQLPPTYEASQNVYEVLPNNYSEFYNDLNMYPTQYYPNNTNYVSTETNDFYHYYTNGMNNYWAVNNNNYYTSM